MNKKLFFSVFTLFAFISNCFTQHIPVFHNFDIKDGLVHSSITAITQDSKGFMWIGTDEGLHRFDGKTFKCFQSSVFENSIPSNRITYLYSHPSKNLVFIGSTEGYLSVYDLSSGLFTNYKLRENERVAYRITAITQLDDDRIIIGLSQPGSIFVFNTLDNTAKEYQLNIDNQNGIKPTIIYNIFIDNEKKIYVSTDIGLLISSKKLDAFHLEKPINYVCGSITDVKTVSQVDTNLLLITTSNKILLYNKIFLKYEDVTPHQFKRLNLKSHIQDGDGTIWISTEASGLIKFNLKSRTYSKIEYNFQKTNSIKNNNIYFIYLSPQEPIIWVGTKTGLSYFGLKDNLFNHYLPLNENNEVIDDNFGLLPASDGSFWIIGRYNLFYAKNIEHQFTVIDKTNPYLGNIADRRVNKIFEDKLNNIWFATSNGLVFYDPVHKRMSVHKVTTAVDENSNFFTNIYYYNDTLWLSSKNGFCLFDMISNRFTTFPSPADLKSKQRRGMVDIVYDPEGYVWLGDRDEGVFRFNLNTKEYTHYLSVLTDSTTLGADAILSLFKDSNGGLWFTSYYNGASRFDKQSNSFKRYSMSEGLPSNTIYNIQEDDNGNLWISTNKGISKYSYEKDKFHNYNFFDGMYIYEFNMSSYARSKDGKMFFGGVGGIISFNPNEVKEVIDPPTFYLTDLYIQNKVISVNSEILNNQSVLTRDEIDLKYQKATISFDVTLLNYLYPHRSGFAWKLSNYDSDWNIARPNQTSISYANLPPGSYDLIVKTTVNFEDWGQEKKVIRITVIPSWWMTAWFKIALIILIIAGVISFFSIRIHFLNKQKEHLNFLVQEKTEELKSLNESLEENNAEIISQNDELERHRHFLELLVSERTTQLKLALQKAEESDLLKSTLLSNMSHEVRTPLNAIVGFTKFINDETLSVEERKEFYDVILSNSMSLLSLFDNIIELSRFQSENYVIDNKPFYLNGFLDAFSEENAKQSSLSVPLIKDFTANDQFQICSDKLKIEIVLKNLLSNAFKYTEKGYVKLGYKIITKNLLIEDFKLNIVSDSNQFIQFYVEDTGVGIANEKREIVFDLFAKAEEPSTKLYQGLGLGLTVCKLIVEILGGTIWYESLPSKGTVFNFALPLNNLN